MPNPKPSVKRSIGVAKGQLRKAEKKTNAAKNRKDPGDRPKNPKKVMSRAAKRAKDSAIIPAKSPANSSRIKRAKQPSRRDRKSA